MGFRIQRRLNITRGMGLNLSKSGISPSLRSDFGSLSLKGLSIRTGIPGVSFRQGFGSKSGNAALIFGIILIFVAMLPIVLNALIVFSQILIIITVWLIRVFLIAPFNILKWIIQILGDYISYWRKSSDINDPS